MNALHSNPLNRPSGENNAKTSARKKRSGSVSPGSADMGTSANDGPAMDTSDMVQPIHRVVDLGIHFFDTTGVCGLLTSEDWSGKALFHTRDKVVMATPSGFVDIHLAEDDLRHIDETTAAVTVEDERHPAALSGYPGL